MKNSNDLISYLEKEVERARKSLKKFQAGLENDPVYALTWFEGAFTAAAEVKVGAAVLVELKNNSVTIDDVRDHVERTIRRLAKYPPRSTSPVSNLMEQEENAAWARLYETLENY